MPKIELKTQIQASIEIVFDLARSIDLHQISTEQTNEKAIEGVTTGLIGLNETVTWRAKHFGVYQNLTAKITEFERPHYFVDEMLQGAFKSFRHEHHFAVKANGTEMMDVFDYQSPLGILGRLADTIFLQQYMTNLLANRNQIIKEFAESEKWRQVLNR